MNSFLGIPAAVILRWSMPLVDGEERADEREGLAPRLWLNGYSMLAVNLPVLEKV